MQQILQLSFGVVTNNIMIKMLSMHIYLNVMVIINDAYFAYIINESTTAAR